jgi:hypothetical protein
MEEQLQQCTAEKTTMAEQLQAVQEQGQRDVDTFHAEKASLIFSTAVCISETGSGFTVPQSIK